MKNTTLLFLLLISLAFTASVCADSDGPQDSSTQASVVISLQDITCQSCGSSVVKLLKRKRGVDAAEFDRVGW